MLHWIKISCRPQITFHIRSTLRRPPGTQLLFRQSGTLTPATLLSVFSYSFITLFKWSLTLISQGWLIWCPTQPSARSDSSHVVSSWQPQMIRTPPPRACAITFIYVILQLRKLCFPVLLTSGITWCMLWNNFFLLSDVPEILSSLECADWLFTVLWTSGICMLRLPVVLQNETSKYLF